VDRAQVAAATRVTLAAWPVIGTAFAASGLLSALGVEDGLEVSVGPALGVALGVPVGAVDVSGVGVGVGFLVGVREQLAFGVGW
jgi:hypothetical protein